MKCPNCDKALKMDDCDQWYCDQCRVTWDENQIVEAAIRLLTEGSPRMSKEEYEAKRKLTLFIDQSSSECGACGAGAFPLENAHFTRAGWGFGSDKGKGLGCGVEWKYVSSNYLGMPDLDRIIQQMRPDLEFWR